MSQASARAGRIALRTFAGLLLSANVTAQAPSPDQLRAKLRDYRAAHDIEIVRELSGFLAIRNLASDRTNIRRNARALRGANLRRC